MGFVYGRIAGRSATEFFFCQLSGKPISFLAGSPRTQPFFFIKTLLHAQK
jgi:hypothetical protein